MWLVAQDDLLNSNQDGGVCLQIRSNMFPGFRIRSHAEAYSQLNRTLGMHSPCFKFVIIGRHNTTATLYDLVINIDKVLEVPFYRSQHQSRRCNCVKCQYSPAVIPGNLYDTCRRSCAYCFCTQVIFKKFMM